MRNRSIRILAAITVASCSSRGAPSTATERGTGIGPMCLHELPGPEPTWFPGCPTWLCGNTARIYGAPIEALDEHAKETQDTFTQPFKLVRGKLTDAKGACAGVTNLSLGVRGGGFVALEGPLDTVKCSGNDLLGARFVVDQGPGPSAGKARLATVRIDAIKDVAVWKRGPQDPERVPTYDLVREKELEHPMEEHLCAPAPWDSSIVNLPFDKTALTRHALLLEGETYSDAATVQRVNTDQTRWFNIGCAGTGVAKLRLLGFDPVRKPDAKGERQATLKMITAKYCGPKSWTREGTILLFVQQSSSASGAPLPNDGGGAEIGPIESQWGPDGALCVSHSRLWSIGSKCEKESESAFIERVRNDCHIPACDETTACESATASGDGVWRTCTVNHTRHTL